MNRGAASRCWGIKKTPARVHHAEVERVAFPMGPGGVIVVRLLVADLHAEVDAVNPQLVLNEEGATGCRRTPC